MRVFLDACVDPRAVELFAGHEARTAFDVGWNRYQDHVLLRLIQGHYDLFVTIDQGFEFEHNLKDFTFGFLIIHVRKNKVQFYRPLAAQISEAMGRVKPGEVIHVRGN
jgi:hypothetical protein